MTIPAHERNFIGQKTDENAIATRMGFGSIETYRAWVAFKNSHNPDEHLAILLVDKFKLAEQLSAIVQHVIYLEAEIEKLKPSSKGE